MKLGVIGLPNVGKSTLFNAITKAGAESANYPFCTIEPNVGVVTVPDGRIDNLSKIYSSKKTIYTTIEFVDIAGLVKGASKGEGLGNKFLSHIREVDAVVHVVRAFEDGNITHVDGSIDPLRDMATINLELILSDMESLSKKIDKAKTMTKTGDKKYQTELQLLERLNAHLESERPIRTMTLTEEEKEYVDGLFMLTSKPVIYAANISENDVSKDPDTLPMVKTIKRQAQEEGAEVIVLCAKIEEELQALSEEEQKLFYEDLGISESGLDKLITACYRLLGLISFLTAGEKETRAWTIRKGTRAPQAAGKIHSDFERGFIRADVVDYPTLMECGGSLTVAKEKGKIRSEGKDYVMQDGDVVVFKFNV